MFEVHAHRGHLHAPVVVVVPAKRDDVPAGGMFASAGSGATPRERELMGAVPDDEMVRAMLPSVKVSAAGLAQAARSAKQERRQHARSLVREKAAEGGGGEE